MSDSKFIPYPSSRKVVDSVVLIKLDSGTIHQAILPKHLLMDFISSTASAGSIKVNEKPIVGIRF